MDRLPKHAGYPVDIKSPLRPCQVVTAQGHSKFVVSPSWVVACHHHWTRLSESSYPVTAAPKRAAGKGPQSVRAATGGPAASNQAAESAGILGMIDPELELQRVLATAAGGGAK